MCLSSVPVSSISVFQPGLAPAGLPVGVLLAVPEAGGLPHESVESVRVSAFGLLQFHGAGIVDLSFPVVAAEINNSRSINRLLNHLPLVIVDLSLPGWAPGYFEASQASPEASVDRLIPWH